MPVYCFSLIPLCFRSTQLHSWNCMHSSRWMPELKEMVQQMRDKIENKNKPKRKVQNVTGNYHIMSFKKVVAMKELRYTKQKQISMYMQKVKGLNHTIQSVSLHVVYLVTGHYEVLIYMHIRSFVEGWIWWSFWGAFSYFCINAYIVGGYSLEADASEHQQYTTTSL